MPYGYGTVQAGSIHFWAGSISVGNMLGNNSTGPIKKTVAINGLNKATLKLSATLHCHVTTKREVLLAVC